MSLAQWGITAGTKGIIRDAEKDGRIKEAVEVAESLTKGFFPDDPRGIKRMFVQFVIFPFCKLWMKDDPSGYEEAKKGL